MKLKLFFLPISIVLTLVAIIWFLKPNWDSNRALKKELKNEKATLQDLSSKGNSLESALNQYQSFSDETSLIDNAMPENANSDKLVAEINDQAGTAGIFLNGINLTETKTKAAKTSTQIKSIEEDSESTPSKSQSESRLVSVKIDLNVVGDYVKLRDFINSLGQTNRFLKVVSASITRSSDKQEGSVPGIVSGNIVCETFYEPQDESVAISDLVFSKDAAMNALLTGKISTKVIDDFKTQRTSEIYELIMGDGQSGKENIFIGNTASKL